MKWYWYAAIAVTVLAIGFFGYKMMSKDKLVRENKNVKPKGTATGVEEALVEETTIEEPKAA